MNLTPEQQELGRRNFMRVLAGTPALAALAAAGAAKGPLRGGPVRLGFIGVGGQGRVLLEQTDPQFAEIVAICDINPLQLQKADESLAKTGHPPAKHYSDWKEMLQKEKLEAIAIAAPLFMHAELAVGCMEAGLHVLSEKMMAWDVASCERIAEAARKNRRVYEVGHQRFYNGVYQASYEGIVKAGLLGEVYHSRLVWHRNGNWRRHIELPSPDYDPSRWGYPTYDHLINWRLYKKYSRGHMAELASHMVAITDWFFGATATAAIGSGGVYRYQDGREIPDHTYVTLEYPGGRTVVFTSIESNAFDNYYEAYYGTKGTLILSGEIDAYFFEEKAAGGAAAGAPKATAIAVTAKAAGPVGAASESRAADAAGGTAGAGRSAGVGDRTLAYRNEVSGFCAAVRTGVPLKCGGERGLSAARACISGFEAMDQQTRIAIKV
jgi:predicted dehydrogenase